MPRAPFLPPMYSPESPEEISRAQREGRPEPGLEKKLYTSGPWHTGNGTISNRCVYGPSSKIASCTFRGFIRNAEEEANAKLISAAPDYYEACQDLPIQVDGESVTNYDRRVLAWFWLHAGKIRAANNKAEGK